MTEKQTPSMQNERQEVYSTTEIFEETKAARTNQDSEIIDQADIDMFNEWAASGNAARRLVDESSPLIVEPRGDTLGSTSPSERGSINVPRRSSSAYESGGEERYEKSSKPTNRTFKAVAGAITGAAVLAAGYAALSETDGGSKNPEQGDLDTSISQIVVSPDANVRFDPYVENRENSNFIGNPGEATEIDTSGGARIVRNENGAWYGVDADQIQSVNGARDKDGVVWINEQGIESVVRLSDDPASVEITDN